MIISKNSVRIPFFSGGSDIPSFYKKDFGLALSATIDKFIYVTVHKPHFSGIRTLYDTIGMENVTSSQDLQHTITREVLNHFRLTEDNRVITSVSDIPSSGSGLGSSSAFTVGLLNCIDKEITLFRENDLFRREKLAKLACDIELDKCGFPIGRQDQYACALGGFNLYRFNSDDTVDIEKLYLKEETFLALQNNLLLFYSGRGRSANEMLQKQSIAFSDEVKRKMVAENRDLAKEAVDLLHKNKPNDFGVLLSVAWERKKSIISNMTNDYFNKVYEIAIKNGATGGKMLGAGGGGFFIFYVPFSCDKAHVITNLEYLTEAKYVPFRFTFAGSQVFEL